MGRLANIHGLIQVVKVISQPVRAVQVVEQWLMSYAVGELHVISETGRMVNKSIVNESYSWEVHSVSIDLGCTYM